MFAEGGCACGAVRYRLLKPPLVVHACHCTDCQRLSGGPYATNAWIEQEFVELNAGQLTSFRRQGGSGSDHDVYFCGTCGTTIWSRYHRAPGNYWWVRVGTLDEPNAVAPDLHIYTRSKHKAVALPPGVPVFEAYYERDKIWSAESLARMEVNIKANLRG